MSCLGYIGRLTSEVRYSLQKGEEIVGLPLSLCSLSKEKLKPSRSDDQWRKLRRLETDVVEGRCRKTERTTLSDGMTRSEGSDGHLRTYYNRRSARERRHCTETL